MTTKTRVQLSVMMFMQFFIWGAWFVTLWRYLTKIGFTGPQIGAAYSTTGWAAIISPFFVGMIADRFFSTEKVLAGLHLLGGVMLYWASTVTSAGTFFQVLLLYTICYMPTLALVNSISFDQMENPAKQFPAVRVLGTIGWIIAGLIIGFMPRGVFGLETIEDTAIPLKIAAAMSIIMGLYCLSLPHTPPKSLGKKITVSDVLGLKALSLLKNRPFAIFVISSFLICIPLSFYYQSANGFLSEAGVANPAAKMTMGQMSEIFFMLVMPFFLTRLGMKKTLLIGMLFWVGRYALFVFGATGGAVMLLYLAILFHGICYDFFFVAGQIYVDNKAPLEVRASAQGFITLVTFGAGMVLGNLVNGWVTGHYTVTAAEGAGHNWRMIWLVPAVMAAVVATIFALLFKDEGNALKNSTARSLDTTKKV